MLNTNIRKLSSNFTAKVDEAYQKKVALSPDLDDTSLEWKDVVRALQDKYYAI